MKSWSDLAFWKSGTWNNIKYTLADKEVYPPREVWFQAMLLTPLLRTRVVILGQDPYPGGQAHGLAFSVKDTSVSLPPTLKNIFKEYQDDLKKPEPKSGNLSAWARRGVLLLNSALTVYPKESGSHKSLGWSELTQEVLRAVHTVNKNAVFVLWGNEAQGIAAPIHGIHKVHSAHPSPLSADRGFFGSRPFTKVNGILMNLKQEPIDWTLPSRNSLDI